MDYGFVSSSNILLAPFRYLTDVHSRVFVFYLLSSAFIAIFIHWLGERQEGSDARNRTAATGIQGLAPRSIYTHPSAIVDYGYFIANGILYAVIIGPVAFFGTWFSSQIFQALQLIGNPIHLVGSPGPVSIVLYSIAIALAADFGVFLSHVLFHRIPMLWEFHKVHHSAEVLTPFTVYRMHPVDDVATLLIGGTLTGIVDAFVRFFIAPGISPYVIYGLGVATFLFYVLGYNLRHSHIWWSFGPTWSKFFISPAQHQIHHSKARKHWDKNFGLMFAIWDWMFGSLYVPVEREDIEFGIGNGEEREFSSPLRLYFVPFVKAGRRIRRKVRKALGLPIQGAKQGAEAGSTTGTK